ncbi:hypothetical protein [Paraliomyxa miuraensis]|uniref:hypothetical protein n=1 Tax=Paraliomyxa miuraensis TaxID=376150 RepID=UPI00225B1B08|nr:hypothetical protein [Paraliomyxa miuraensis]MCX4246806.1 hypothetical protein [Paraliomyxa miuraensis]
MRIGPRWIPLVSWLAFGCDHADALPVTPGIPEPLACRSRVDPEQLLPSDAVIVGYYDMARERRLAPDVSATNAAGPRALLPLIELEAARLAWVGLVAACELDQDFLRESWFSVDRSEELLAVVTGKGIGDGDALRCLQRQLGRWEPDLLDTTIAGDGCGVSFEYDGMLAFAPHDELLVLGTEGAVARARHAWSSGRGSGPTDLLPRRRPNKSYVWAAADLSAWLTPEELEHELSSTAIEDLDPLAAVRTVEVEAQLGRRYSLRVGSSFRVESDARAVEAMIRALLDSPPPSLPDWAIELIGTLELSRKHTHVDLVLPLSRRQAHQLGLLPNETEAKQVPAFPWLALLLLL